MADLNIIAGDTHSFPVEVMKDNEPFDLQGYNIFFTIKDDLRKNDEKALYKQDIVIPSGEAIYSFDIGLPSEATIDLPDKVYYFNLRFKSPDNKYNSTTNQRIHIVRGATSRINAD